MGLKDDPHKAQLREAGWRTRGYLPHFDGRPIPQFITLHLADSVPLAVIERWRNELRTLKSEDRKTLLRNRIERYLDMGYGQCFLRDERIATLVQNSLLHFADVRYRPHSWAVMPNHLHFMLTRFKNFHIEDIMHSIKSYTAHKANEILGRCGDFWFEEYFDRFMRDVKHFQNTVCYIENNPVKARLCKRVDEWPFSSAWFRARDSLKK